MDDSSIYEELTTPTTAIEEAAALSQQLLDAEQKLEKAEQAFKDAQAAYNKLAMDIIPEFYKTNGLSKLSLADGTVLSVEQKITCSPTKAKKPELIKWLKAHGGSDIVKEELSVNDVFAERLAAAGVPFIAKGDVNTASLKSWLSEQLGLKAGCVSKMNYTDIPDYVNFYRYNTTVVTKPKS